MFLVGVVFCNLEVVHRADRSCGGVILCVCVCVCVCVCERERERERERKCVSVILKLKKLSPGPLGAVTPWGWELCSVYSETGNLVPCLTFGRRNYFF